MNLLDAMIVPEWSFLLPLAVALGASLYLGVLGLTLLPLVPGFSELPGDLDLLADPATSVAAAALYCVAWAVRGHPSLELVWAVGNVGIRFVAVGLLGLFLFPEGLALSSAPLVFGAAIAAAFVQFQRVGWIVLDHHGGWIPARRWLQRLGVEAVTLGVLWLALLDPFIGLVVSAFALILFATWGRPCYRAGWLGVAILVGAYRMVSGRSGWLVGAALPRWVPRFFARGSSGGAGSVRATRAALVLPDRGQTLLLGWLVAMGPGPVFLYRSLRRASEISLHGTSAEGWRRTFHVTELLVRGSRERLALLIPPGGPRPEELEGIFVGVPTPQNL